MWALFGVASMIVGDEVDERGSGPVPHQDDTADGWFPESVAADYDAPGVPMRPNWWGPLRRS